MGHKHKAPRPSPLTLLAIFHARALGVPFRVISEETQIAESTLNRWFKEWGHERHLYHRLIAPFSEKNEKRILLAVIRQKGMKLPQVCGAPRLFNLDPTEKAP